MQPTLSVFQANVVMRLLAMLVLVIVTATQAQVVRQISCHLHCIAENAARLAQAQRCAQTVHAQMVSGTQVQPATLNKHVLQAGNNQLNEVSFSDLYTAAQ
jgi:hypothetical protein